MTQRIHEWLEASNLNKQQNWGASKQIPLIICDIPFSYETRLLIYSHLYVTRLLGIRRIHVWLEASNLSKQQNWGASKQIPLIIYDIPFSYAARLLIYSHLYVTRLLGIRHNAFMCGLSLNCLSNTAIQSPMIGVLARRSLNHMGHASFIHDMPPHSYVTCLLIYLWHASSIRAMPHHLFGHHIWHASLLHDIQYLRVPWGRQIWANSLSGVLVSRSLHVGWLRLVGSLKW